MEGIDIVKGIFSLIVSIGKSFFGIFTELAKVILSFRK